MNLGAEDTFRDKRHLAMQIISNIKLDPYLSVKDVILGDRMSKMGFEYVLSRYFDVYAPRFMARPDIIIVAEDIKNVVDEWLLVAVELKYFKVSGDAKKFERDLRKAFREIGQPLRYYLYGFDSAVLWHIFEGDADVEALRSYSKLVSEFFKKLRLPIVYFSTRILDKDDFLVFQPLETSSPSNTGYIVRRMLNYCRDGVRNPLLPQDKEIKERRRALKTILKVP